MWDDDHTIDMKVSPGSTKPLGCLIVGYMGHQLGITNHPTLLINQQRFIHRPLALSAHCTWGQLYKTQIGKIHGFPFGKWPTQFWFSMCHYIYVNLLIMMVNYSKYPSDSKSWIYLIVSSRLITPITVDVIFGYISNYMNPYYSIC